MNLINSRDVTKRVTSLLNVARESRVYISVPIFRFIRLPKHANCKEYNKRFFIIREKGCDSEEVHPSVQVK